MRVSSNINVVMLTGNLTRDGELRVTQGGTQVLRLGVAVNDRRRSPQSGEWEDVPNFIDCTVLGNRAEAIARHMLKGTKVAIRGRLHWHSWEAQDGSKRSKVDVTVDDVEFMSRGQQGQQQADQPAYRAPAPPAAPRPQAPAGRPRQQAQAQADDVYDEDIPF